ncbi:hypothetical protein GCM10008090_08240 [Arenicella chitinivorans]|uniref:DUF58 domain-containing protein n=2 Tax=Arenicella chitinivorans TaxID=1329800 RepID=A0A918RL95_9GAMM|nr:hypothetical protein GCM10008090_08240 [Arenicella chitinivorans]
MEFEEVRHYQAGDDIRSIDWKVSARTGETFTKLFCEDRERPCHIILDQRASMFFGSETQFKSVLATELAVALAWAALNGGDRVGGQVLGQGRELDCRAKRHKSAVLQFLHHSVAMNHALLTPTPRMESGAAPASVLSLAQSLTECRRITRPGTAVFIVSDFNGLGAEFEQALSTLARHTDVTLIQVYDPFELSLPVDGDLRISDGQHHTRIRWTAGLQRQYQRLVSEREDALHTAAKRARARLLTASTAIKARSILGSVYRD